MQFSTEQLILFGGLLVSTIGFLFRALAKAWQEQRDFIMGELEECKTVAKASTEQTSRVADVAARGQVVAAEVAKKATGTDV